MKPLLALVAAAVTCALLFLALRDDGAGGSQGEGPGRVSAAGDAAADPGARRVGTIEDGADAETRVATTGDARADAVTPPAADAAAAAPAEGPIAFGRVTDAADRPLAGADVSLSRFGLGFDPFEGPAGGGRVSSDADGRFELDLSGQGNRVQVMAGADGYAPLSRSVDLESLPEGEGRIDLGTLRLPGG